MQTIQTSCLNGLPDQVIRPFMLRRTKRDVEKELPGKTEHVVKCALSAWQQCLIQQISNEVGLSAGCDAVCCMHIQPKYCLASFLLKAIYAVCMVCSCCKGTGGHLP